MVSILPGIESVATGNSDSSIVSRLTMIAVRLFSGG